MAAEEKSDAVMKDQARFDELMKHAPDNDALRASLTKLWTNPPLEPMRRAFDKCDSENEARRILFFPEAKDGQAYAQIIKHPKDGLPHAARPALGLMFMLHHKSDFHRAFAVSGGLEGLAARLQEEDQHVRAHAVEIFLRVTGDESLKWYVAPASDDEVKMHRSLLDLGDRMIPDLVANSRDSYPGGEKACLDLLAFWLGWARQMHCETHVLNPSRLLIEALSDWVIRAERRGDPEESGLAKRLFDDFSRCDPCSGTGWVGGLVLCKATDDDVIEMSGGFDLDSKPKSKPKPMPPPPPPRKIEMKPRQAGNQAFAAGDFEKALQHYDAALTEENETAISTLQCNRATCLVKLAARDVSDDSKNKAWLQRAEEACDAALDADPRNSKARYRLAQTLAALGDERLGEAIAAARSARRSIIDERAGDAQRGAVADLLLALLDRDKATNDRTSRIARGLLRARRGGKGHEMTRGWKRPGSEKTKKAAVQKGFMDPKPRDYASSDDELVVEDVTKTVDEDASDSDEARTAVVDAAADSDDDELMAVRKAEDDQRKLRRKARIVAKENKKASEKPSEKAARKAARVQRILKMSMS
jgi:tetratricopeptide (TPR) repeat protein